jgi:ribose transport system ATP-binding protein
MADDIPLLRIAGLGKRFYGTHALNDVDLTLRAGEIHALIGENGAGKSTLIKILAGVYGAEEGTIALRGEAVNPVTQRLPIAFVHQDLGLVDDLSVGENVALVAGFPKRHGLIDWPQVGRQAIELYDRMEIEAPDPQSPVGSLNAAGKALLGIVRALASRADLVVLDEPTASLPEPDALHLLDVLRRLRATGAGIIYVSHRLNELFGFADSVSVLRDGRLVRSAAMASVTPSSLVQDMLGRAVEFAHGHAEPAANKPALLFVEALRLHGFGPVTFSVAAGEIAALVGLRGAGQDEIGRAIFGALETRSGTIHLGGELLPPRETITDRMARGIALLAGDRGRESALGGMSISENLFPSQSIVKTGSLAFLSPAADRARTGEVMERFDVRPRNPDALIDWLSGGNQQKIFVARWLAAGARLLILEEPTAGVDIGAKLAIHAMVRDAARAGAAVLIVSSDFEEVATLADRALVMGRGQISGELSGAALTMDSLIARSSLGEDFAASDYAPATLNA